MLAAACAVILVVMAGYYFKERHSDSAKEMAMVTEFMPPQDLEVIKHLDLLKDMDTIEKLIHVVDIPENGTGTEQDASETQGMYPDENGKSYA
jgi:5,10-methylenetetrahydrofolate reductase